MNTEELERITQQAMREVNRMYAKLMPRSPSYRYFTRVGSKDRYFWTTEKINHKERPRYVAGVYRHLKTKNQMKLVKKVGFAKKYKAKEWAKAMMHKEQNEKATPSKE